MFVNTGWHHLYKNYIPSRVFMTPGNFVPFSHLGCILDKRPKVGDTIVLGVLKKKKALYSNPFIDEELEIPFWKATSVFSYEAESLWGMLREIPEKQIS